jgi:3-hydroxyisobutyrate dehydrogenase-like beta-hydroxyacid dehydrogenase
MQEKAVSSVALIGTGAMGSRMATRLLQAGIPLTVWNRTAARAEPLVALGARLASSPSEAAQQAAFVLVMVEGDEASHAVWSGPDGIGAGLSAETIAVECSTLSVGRIEALAEEVARKSWRFVEAPVSGSLPQAEAGMLAFFAGGDFYDVNEVTPLLRSIGRVVHHVGTPPVATKVKLAVNGMLACQVASTAETLGFFARAGLPLHTIRALLEDTPVMSPIVAATTRQIAAGDYAPLFPISLVLKDLGYLAAVAEAANAPSPLAQTTRNVFEEADTWRSENISAVAKLFAAYLPERIPSL